MVFTIPRALRRLFLRERRLLGILTRCAFETARRCLSERLLNVEDGLPGMVAALQTFDSRLGWNPHVHCLLTDGLLLPGGGFAGAGLWDEDAEGLFVETWRRLVLQALVEEERLTAGFMEKLLGFRDAGGFSVYGRHLVLFEEEERLDHLVSYAVRPPLAAHRFHEQEDGRLLLVVPPDPATGSRELSLEPLEWIRRLTNQIPAPRSHMVRSYGAYANRRRSRYREGGESPVGGCGSPGGKEGRVEKGEEEKRSRASWARLLRRVFGVDALHCPRCGGRMEVIAVLTDPEVVDRVLSHVRKKGSPEEGGAAARGPPRG